MTTTNQLCLVINCGSSSIKFCIFADAERLPVLSGLAENLGQSNGRLIIKRDGEKLQFDLTGGDHRAALTTLIGYLEQQGLLQAVIAVGHRIVHGGERFKTSTLIDDKVLGDIEAVSKLAPLHNPANLAGVRMAMEALPSVPHVAVFDTAFHTTIPQPAYRYAIPGDCYSELGIRRYGFHGTSHRFVAMEAVTLLDLDAADHGIVVAHLGNGASATAICNGRSLDTTMGFTPLEGLVMGSRSGDIDPGALFHIARERSLGVDGLDALLNRQSGLLGLSGLSNDCRTLEAAAEENHADAQLALDVFAHRLARSIGALATSLTRLDAVIFTGGIGENSALIRRMTIERLTILGLTLDEEANARMKGGQCGRISLAGATPAVAVIATNEEWMIASDTLTVIAQPVAA